MDNCKNPNDHSGHLCVLASGKQIEQIEKLAKCPRFICFNCGRVAHAAKNLCNPMPLKEDSGK
ncbi:MAG: hypothetical protein ACOYCD_00295 [Kiritimatiellia bacterium]|jgi:hypothetical protein